MKRCCRCGVEKTADQFNKYRNGLSGHCRDCNKEYCRDYGARRYATDPEFVERERLRAQENRSSRPYRLVQMFHTVKKSAQARGIHVAIEKSDIARLMNEQGWKCARTGIPLDLTSGKGKRPFGPTVDRIDNERGYETDNIQIVCNIYNFAKNEFRDEDVLTFAKALLNARTH